MSSLLATAALALFTLVAAALTFFGYDLVRPLSRVTGPLAGSVAALVLVVGVATRSPIEWEATGLLLVTFGLLLVCGAGATLALSRFEALSGPMLGATTTLLAALVVLSEGRLFDAMVLARAEYAAGSGLLVVAEGLLTAPVFDLPVFRMALLTSLLLASVAGLVAVRYPGEILTLSLAVLGAAILSLTVPTLTGAPGLQLDFSGGTTVDPVWLLLFLAAGLAFQLRRFGDRLALTALDGRSNGSGQQ